MCLLQNLKKGHACLYAQLGPSFFSPQVFGILQRVSINLKSFEFLRVLQIQMREHIQKKLMFQQHEQTQSKQPPSRKHVYTYFQNYKFQELQILPTKLQRFDVYFLLKLIVFDEK
ncbi:hypothetical protein ABPG74_022088 [Tetrahymena malaccensis]